MDMALPPQLDAASRSAPERRVPAQLLNYGQKRCVALSMHMAIEILDTPSTVDVPGASYYCRQLVRWHNQWLPLIDLATLMRAYLPQGGAAPARYALVVAYQAAPRAPVMHGAIGLQALPKVIDVGDDMQCDLPTDSDLWPLLALACVRHAGWRVPIIDTGRLFSSYLD